MTHLLDFVEGIPETEIAGGELIIEQGQPMNKLFILKEGEIEVFRDDTEVCRISREGSCFGEISALLDIKPTASVKTTCPSTFIVINHPSAFFAENIEALFEITRLLAFRVHWLTANYAEAIDDPYGESSVARRMHLNR